MNANLESSPLELIRRVHGEKHRAYGDSWKKRGETVSILANIARKVDRLGSPGAGDSELDTRLDLTAYLAKYAVWVYEHTGSVLVLTDKDVEWALYEELAALKDQSSIPLSDREEPVYSVVNAVRRTALPVHTSTTDDRFTSHLRTDFDRLLKAAEQGMSDAWGRIDTLGHMLEISWVLFYREWMREHRRRLMWDPSGEEGE